MFPGGGDRAVGDQQGGAARTGCWRLSVNGPWPLVSLLPIAATSKPGQVLSRPTSRVRSPGRFTDAVVLRSQTDLTGSGPASDNIAAGAGTPPAAVDFR